MMPHTPPDGERDSSLEYWKEYGQIVVDISNLVSALEARETDHESIHTFRFFDVEGPFDIPSSITEHIGEVTSSDVTFHDTPTWNGLTIELYGENGSYVISRDSDAHDKTPQDTIFHFKPLSPFDRALLTEKEARALPQHGSHSKTFKTLYSQQQGLTTADTLLILMKLSHPTADISLDDNRQKQLSNKSLFEPHVYSSLLDSARMGAFSETGRIHYDILTSDDASVTYMFEADQPPSFQLRILDDVTRQPLRLQGSIEKNAIFDFPRHAVTNGYDKDWPIDSVRSDAPTLRELRLMRAAIQEELESLPDQDDLPIEGSFLDPDTVIDDKDPLTATEEAIQNDRQFDTMVFDHELQDLLESDDDSKD